MWLVSVTLLICAQMHLDTNAKCHVNWEIFLTILISWFCLFFATNFVHSIASELNHWIHDWRLWILSTQILLAYFHLYLRKLKLPNFNLYEFCWKLKNIQLWFHGCRRVEPHTFGKNEIILFTEFVMVRKIAADRSCACAERRCRTNWSWIICMVMWWLWLVDCSHAFLVIAYFFYGLLEFRISQ